jgi:hypothetical protein
MLRGRLLLLLVLGACVSPPPPAPPPPPVQKAQPIPPAPSKWPYWEPVPVDLRTPVETEIPVGKAGDLPEPAWLASDDTWRGASSSILGKLRETGLALRTTGLREGSIGLFYEHRAERGAPLVVTVDALFALAHLALGSALGEVEVRVLGPGLSLMLHRLDARLGAEAKRARPDLAEGYRVARTVVAVALAVSDSTYLVPADLIDSALPEASLVRAHAGIERSPLLGVALDYARATPRGPIAEERDPRVPGFEAAEWLALAPFLFAGATEKNGAKIDVGAARGQARAALLLARLLLKEGDPVAGAAFARMTLLDRFVLGAAEDSSPTDIAEIARRASFDLNGGADIADAPKLDRLRHLAAPRSMRLVPLRAAPEGPALAHPPPSALEVGKWLRSSSSANEDRHGSVYGSLLEAMASWLRPSAATSPSGSETKRRLGTALAAWTLLRHDALAFAHDVPTGPAPAVAPARPVTSRLTQVFVEPHPESIASLLGAVRQLRLGLLDLGGLEREGSSSIILGEVESILTLALEGAVRAANDDPELATLSPALAQIPPRIAALEAWAGPAASPVVIDVHVDEIAGRVLEEGTGPLEELFLRVRDPKTHQLVIALGAAIPRVEREERASHPLNDATWRRRIEEGLLFKGEAE